MMQTRNNRNRKDINMARGHSRSLFGLLASNRGAVLIEFAFIVPVLILMFLGVVEITRYILIKEKVVNASASMAQYVSQRASTTAPGNLELAYQSMMKPFDPGNGGYIVTLLERSGGANSSITQNQIINEGETGESKVAKLAADLKDVLLPIDGNPTRDQLIVVETFYNYKGIVPGAENFSKALNVDGQLYNMSTVLRRNNRTNPTGEETSIPAPYGCCGEFCLPKDRPAGVRCNPCNKNPPQECALKGSTAFGLPECVSCPSKGCTPDSKTCACNKAYCEHTGG